MIVELFGLPGGGKTTAAKRLAAEGASVITIKNKGELVILNLKALLKRPRATLNLLIFTVTHSTLKTFWFKFANLYLHANAKYEKSLSAPVNVIDQGYLQSIMSAPSRVLAPEEMKQILERALLPDVVAIFKVSPESQSQRLQGRHYIVREQEGENAFTERLEVMRKNHDELIGQLQTRVGVRIVLIPEHATTEEAHAMLHTLI